MENSAATWSALAWPVKEPGAKHAPNLLWKFVAVTGLKRLDLPREQALQVGVGLGVGPTTTQPVGGEHDCALLRIELQ